ncbi:MAG TPA: cytochrome c [Bacteroidia bacterium]|jgi:hypothetical protein|nr:cytochrome c [Bacteroidia bacterium]
MKTRIRFTILSVSFALLGAVIISAGVTSCKVPEAIAAKSGAQLWGENCNRCHNAPDPRTYSDDQWDAACEHMRQKAILTNAEIVKIKDFLKSAN